MSDWKALLALRVAKTSCAAVARELGYSRTAVSLVLRGKYPGKTDKMAERIAARYSRAPCLWNGEPVTPADCARYAGRVPTSNPAELRRWRACQHCERNTLKDREENKK